MQVYEAAENYLECILILREKNGQVRSTDIADYLGVTKPTVSYTMKQFRQKDYIQMDQNGAIHLTPQGESIAKRIYARHVLLTKVLMDLGVSEETARLDACKLEHGLSDESFLSIQKHYEKRGR
jgi:Mn-dependent DtxR family transcriptional regulator